METTSSSPPEDPTVAQPPDPTAYPPVGPVKVTFVPGATPQFTFTPSTVRVKDGPKTVVLIQNPPATWDFVTAKVKDDPFDQFSPSVHGKTLHIDDALKDPDLEAYSYNITVKLDGTEYTSPDPHIVNDPP